MKKTTLILSLAFVAGCSNIISKQENKSTEQEEYPKNFAEIVKSHYYTNSKYPEEIRFNIIHSPKYFSILDGIPQAKPGYIVCADLNLKNSRGEYTGHHTDGLLIKGGRVVQLIERGQWLGKSVC